MSVLASESGPFDCLLSGASSGIGLAMAQALLQEGLAGRSVGRLHALSRNANRREALTALQAEHGDRLCRWDVDLAEPAAIERFGQALVDQGERPSLIINAAGVLHGDGLQPEKSLVQLEPAALQASFALNAFAPILLARALWPLLRAGPLVYASLSARVGSIGDNRLGGWYAYRASKAAQNQLLRTLAIELRRVNRQACCLLLHPGTVDTPLSAPFQGNVPESQLFSPARAAAQLLGIIASAQASDSARFLAWDGSEIPW